MLTIKVNSKDTASRVVIPTRASSPCLKMFFFYSNMATKYTTHELQTMKLLISCSRGVSRYHLYNENRETTGWKMFEVATDSSSTSNAFYLRLFSQATNSWARSTSPYHTIHRESCFLLSGRFYTDVIEIMWLNNAGSSYYYTFVGVVWLHWCTELPSGPHCPWRGILQCSLASSSGYPASPCPPGITGCTNVCRSQIQFIKSFLGTRQFLGGSQILWGNDWCWWMHEWLPWGQLETTCPKHKSQGRGILFNSGH